MCIFNVMKNVADFLHFILLLPFYVCYQNNLMYKFHKNSCMNSKPQQVARKTMLEPSVGQCVNPSVFFFSLRQISRNPVCKYTYCQKFCNTCIFNVMENVADCFQFARNFDFKSLACFFFFLFFLYFFFWYILTLLNLKLIRIVLLIKTKVQICNLVGSFDVTISWSNACVVKRESNIYMQTYTSVLTFSFILLQKGYKIILNFYFTMNIRLNSQI